MKAEFETSEQLSTVVPSLAGAVIAPPSAEMIAHEQDVTDFLISAGLIESKKRKRKLLAMNSHAFQGLKLNSVIGLFCKVYKYP